MTYDFLIDKFSFLIQVCENTTCGHHNFHTDKYQEIHRHINADNSFGADLLKNIITILIALFAGFLALYQMKANVISSSRIRWIEDLRDTLSKMYPVTLLSITYIRNIREAHSAGDKPRQDAAYNDYVKHLHEYNALSNKAKMLLNSDETEHKKIEDLLTKIDDNLHKLNIINANDEEIEKDLKAIVGLAKTIFKNEWTKSKRIFKI